MDLGKQAANLWWRLVGTGFHLLYNQMAFTYDTVSRVVSLGEWQSWVLSVIPHLKTPPGTPVLELAHGTATLQIALQTMGYHNVGIDLSSAMGRLAQQKLQAAGLAPRLAQADAGALPFAAESFAAVACTFPTAFILAPQTLSEVWRVLQPNGRLVIVPNAALTSGGLAQQGIEAAYRATGQNTTANPALQAELTNRFAQARFGLSQTTLRRPRSIVTILIAEKLV
jgi:ubiquinone/menaquinone biosynthesis C-methylase UbiE